MFVLPQSKEYFEKLLNRRNGFMVGVRRGDDMIAQIAMMGPFTLEEAITTNAITRNDVNFHHAEPTDLVVIAKSMAVHPDYRGNDLSQSILEAALDQTLVRTSDHVFAQISVENARSWELFLRHGFCITAAAIDQSDQKPRFIVQKPAMGFALHYASSVDGIHAYGDFVDIMSLTGREALIGQFDMIGTGQLAFYASQDMAAAWSDEPVTLVRNR
jgi:GNAT superfamily N-acetyltransferase